MNCTLSKRKIKHYSIIFLIFAFVTGSYIHIGSTALSGTNIIAALGIFFILNDLSKNKSKFNVFKFLGAISIFLIVLLAGYSLILNNTEPNIRLLRNAITAFVAIYLGSLVAERYPRELTKALQVSIIFYLIIALLQFSYLILGYGFNPADRFVDAGFFDASLSNIGFPSVFTNPNDFSLISLLILIYFMFAATARINNYFIIIAMLCIFVSGSKVAILISFIAIILKMQLEKSMKAYLALFFIILCAALIYFSFPEEGVGLYSIDRFIVTILEILSGSLDVNSSISIRLQSLVYFLSNYNNFLWGIFEAGVPFTQFAYADFKTDLIELNPHSFVIEIHALFGIFGLFIIIGVFTSVFLLLLKKYNLFISLYLWISFVLISSIPSSILGISSYFALVACIIQTKSNQSKVFQKQLL